MLSSTILKWKMRPSIASFLLQSVIILPYSSHSSWELVVTICLMILDKTNQSAPQTTQWCRGTPKRSHPCWTSLRSVFSITWRVSRNKHQTSIVSVFPSDESPQELLDFLYDLWLPYTYPYHPKTETGRTQKTHPGLRHLWGIAMS